MSIVWISSYPKSGNTWLRFMLYAVIFGPPGSSADVPTKIPDLHRGMDPDFKPTQTTYIKTHFELTDAHPMLDQSLKAIHIIRNPRDILLSTLNYRKLTGEGSWALTKKSFAKSFIKLGGDPDFAKIGFGTWATHARSWRNNTRFPVLPLRYEELKADPSGQLRTILDFLEIDANDDRIKQAVASSSFETMRQIEIKEKSAQQSDPRAKQFFVGSNTATRKGVYFMNKGASNQSLDTIAQGLDEQFDHGLKSELEEFGY